MAGTGGGGREPPEAGVCSRGSEHCTPTWRPSPRAGGAEAPWWWGQQALCRGHGRPWPTVHHAAGVRGAPPGRWSVLPGTPLTLLIGTWCLEDVPAPGRCALHCQASPAHPHTPSWDPCAGRVGALVPPLPPALGTSLLHPDRRAALLLSHGPCHCLGWPLPPFIHTTVSSPWDSGALSSRR